MWLLALLQPLVNPILSLQPLMSLTPPPRLLLILSRLPQLHLTLSPLPAAQSMAQLETVHNHNGKVTTIVMTQTTMLPATGMVVTAVLALIVTLTRMPIAMTAPAWTLDRRKPWKLMLKAKLPTYLIVKHR